MFSLIRNGYAGDCRIRIKTNSHVSFILWYVCGRIMFMLVRLETGKTMTCMRYKLCPITFALIINGVALSCFLLRDKPLLM